MIYCWQTSNNYCNSFPAVRILGQVKKEICVSRSRKIRSQDDNLKHFTNGVCEKSGKTLVPTNRTMFDSVLDFLNSLDKLKKF